LYCRRRIVESSRIDLNTTKGTDLRNTALGFGSKAILQKVGVWDALQGDLAEIESVHVSQQGKFGVTRLNKETESLPALGYLAPNHKILSALYANLEAHANVKIIDQVSDLQLTPGPQSVEVKLSYEGQAQLITSRLLVGADGTQSAVRQQLQIDADITDYEQSAVIANVSTSAFTTGVAYERFTKQGLVAMLPLADQQYSMVWTMPPEKCGDLLELPDAEFLQRLQKQFGYRSGIFNACGARQTYPLRLLRAKQIFRDRCLLIGNAAYTVHPIAGQGFNLALRDVDYLADLLMETVDPGLNVLLAQYESERREDVDRIIRFTDGLLRLFRNPLRGLAHARGVALTILGQFPPLQRRVSRQGLGLFRHASQAASKPSGKIL